MCCNPQMDISCLSFVHQRMVYLIGFLCFCRKEYPYDEAKQRETESIYDEFYGNLGLKQDPTLEDLAGDNLDTGEETHPNQ